MQERILLAPNGTELLRTLARHGFSTLGLRIMSPAELAAFMLMRSGVPLPSEIAAHDTEANLIYRFLTEIPYFQSASYRDALNLADTLRTLRFQISGNERDSIVNGLQNSPFTEKNQALLAVYDRYLAALQNNALIDTVGMIRFAIAHARPLTADCLVLREYPLAPLERTLIETASDGHYKRIALRELLGKKEVPLAMPRITEAYGAVNEAEAVIGSIYQEKRSLDCCTVAVSEPSVYVPLLFELTSRFSIPATFGCGFPITLTFPAAVLQNYRNWLTNGHCGVDALRELLTAPSFDRELFCADFGIEQLHLLIETAGFMRLGTDTERNARRIRQYSESAQRDKQLTAQLTAVFVTFGMDCAELIRRYAKIRRNALGKSDTAAANRICDTLGHFSASDCPPPDSLFADLLSVYIGAENSCEGALHITTLSGALTTLRENLFVTGLSAELFPGAPTENYLLLDDELEAFGNDAPTSRRRILQTQNFLHDLLKNAAALGCHTCLSYCGYDTAELKANNASSVLYQLFLEAGGTEETAFQNAIRKVGYFSQNLPGLTEIGRAALVGETVTPHEPASAECPDVSGNLRVLSPSKIEQYLACPKAFCYEHIMGLSETEKDDVFEVMNPVTFGTLVHTAMERLCGGAPDQDTFLAEAKQIFAQFLTERPPMYPHDAERYLHDFMQTAENGFYAALGQQIETAEQDISAEYECGITVRGRPDAIAKLPDGSHRIIDYKTGKTLRHTENDCISCIQVMLYADMLHRSGMEISGGDYRYLRISRTVSCDYTPACAAQIQHILAEIAEAMKTHSYPANASADNCKYCPFRKYCEEGAAIK